MFVSASYGSAMTASCLARLLPYYMILLLLLCCTAVALCRPVRPPFCCCPSWHHIVLRGCYCLRSSREGGAFCCVATGCCGYGCGVILSCDSCYGGCQTRCVMLRGCYRVTRWWRHLVFSRLLQFWQWHHLVLRGRHSFRTGVVFLCCKVSHHRVARRRASFCL